MRSEHDLLDADHLFDELFEYVCSLHRLAANRAPLVAERIRRDLDRLRRDAADRASRLGSAVESDWRDIQKPLCCFLDFMVESTGDRALEGTWSADFRFAKSVGIGAGDVAFRELLERDLSEAESARGDLDPGMKWRLVFYYRCLLLGFQSDSEGDREGDDLDDRNPRPRSGDKDFRRRLAALLKPATPTERVTPDAYDNPQSQKLHLNSAPAMWGMVAVLVVFALVFFGFTGYLYTRASLRLQEAVQYLETQLNR